MRFFTRAWHSAELSEAECDELERLYRDEHLPAILTGLPRPLAELAQRCSEAGEHLSIHDARIRGLVVDPETARVALELRTLSHAQGDADLKLEFRGVDMTRLDRDLLERVARDPLTELLYDEVDREPDGRFAYRVLLWPKEELEIVFQDFAWSRA